MGIEYDNEALAIAICKRDPDADKWAYNKHCSYCGKFLYPEERDSKCKKCGVKANNAIARAIPFLTSATAIEKLIIWIKDRDGNLINRISSIMSDWMLSPHNPESYKLKIVIECVDALG